MIKLVIFDWNGTLLADTGPVVEGTNKELQVLGLPPITVRDYQRLFEVPMAKFYKHFGVSKELFREKSTEMAKAFHSFYEPRVARARTRSGARTTLKSLDTKGYSKIILSNHTVEGIYFQLERLKLSTYFDSILANDVLDGAHFKGKQHRLEEYIKSNGINPSSAIIVGDTIEEIQIGKSMGLKTVSITGGYNSTKRLKAAKPDVLVHSLHEIIQIIEET